MTDPSTIQFQGGDVLANLDERTITGLLIPYNEVGSTNIGAFQVEAGTIAIPADHSIVGLNTDHDRPNVVGRATRVWEEPRGIMATYTIANTPEGDAALLDAVSPTGKRRKLSAEFGPAMIKAGKLVAGHAKLWGSALVEAGAFPSAQVLAADTPPATEGEHIAVEVPVLPIDIVASTPAGESATYTTEAAPAAPANQEGGSSVTASAVAPAAPVATVPPTLAPGAPVLAALSPAPVAAPVITERPVDIQQVLAAISAVKANPSDRDAEQVLAALTDIKISGSGALPADGVLRPNWVGLLEAGSTYEREYIGLGKHGTDISAAGKTGFRVKRGTSGSPISGPAGIPNGGDWAGNKAEINSYAGRTETASSSLRRFAVGNDIAREFYDLQGGAEVIESFLSLVIEDYMYWSDMWALYDLITAPGAPVAAKTYPSDYPAAVGMLIQGILAVKRRKSDGRRDVPTYAIANEEAYEALAYAAGGAEHLPAFVSLAISTASKGTVDGNVVIVEGDNGITGTAAVSVGAQRAIDFDEVPGGPLKIDALELAKGGIDRAVHGYLQTFKKRDEAFVTIGTPEARVNSTAYPLGRMHKASAVVYRVTVAGTSGVSAPTAPSVGETVADGTTTLLRLA